VTGATTTSEYAIPRTSRTLAGKLSLVLILILLESKLPSCVSGLLTIACTGGRSDMLCKKCLSIMFQKERNVYITECRSIEVSVTRSYPNGFRRDADHLSARALFRHHTDNNDSSTTIITGILCAHRDAMTSSHEPLEERPRSIYM